MCSVSGDIKSMLQEIKTKGIVLSAAPHGEYDKRLVILSETEGVFQIFIHHTGSI